MTRLAFALAAALAVAPGCSGASDGGGAPDAALVLVPLDGEAPAGASVARVEVASTPDARERGLMLRDRLPEDTGMLFAYPEAREVSFWMKNCRHPLSLAFLDAEGRIVGLTEMSPGFGLPDSELPMYPSKRAVRFALEMDAGWFAKRGLRIGDRVDAAAAMRGVVPR